MARLKHFKWRHLAPKKFKFHAGVKKCHFGNFCFEFLWIPRKIERQNWRGPIFLKFNLVKYQCDYIIGVLKILQPKSFISLDDLGFGVWLLKSNLLLTPSIFFLTTIFIPFVGKNVPIVEPNYTDFYLKSTAHVVPTDIWTW